MAKVVVTLRKVMGLKNIQQPSIPTIIGGLEFAKTTNIVQKNANAAAIIATIDIIIIILKTYLLVMEIVALIYSLRPLIEKATKIAAAILNPAMLGEILADIQDLVISMATAALYEIIETIQNTILDYPVVVDL